MATDRNKPRPVAISFAQKLSCSEENSENTPENVSQRDEGLTIALSVGDTTEEKC